MRILTATLCIKDTWVSGGEKRGSATWGQKCDSAGIYGPGFCCLSQPSSSNIVYSCYFRYCFSFIYFFVPLFCFRRALHWTRLIEMVGAERKPARAAAHKRDYVIICIYNAENGNNNGIFHHPTSVNTYTHTLYIYR